MGCEKCRFFYLDEDCGIFDIGRCHYTGEDGQAPCEVEELDEVYNAYQDE